MTLDQCYATYQGTVVLVDGNPADAGQCVQWADVVLAHVYGKVTHYGNAIDWWTDPGDLLSDGFEKITDGSIKKGDFVVFNQQVGSVYGHIDVAMADGSVGNFLGSDCNWGGNMTVHEVQHSNSNYVLGSLRLKGGTMSASQDSVDETAVKQAYDIGLLRDPTQQEVDSRVGSSQTLQAMQSSIIASAEHKLIISDRNLGVKLRTILGDSSITPDNLEAALEAKYGSVNKQSVVNYINQHLS